MIRTNTKTIGIIKTIGIAFFPFCTVH
jgi:hypothetical protein